MESIKISTGGCSLICVIIECCQKVLAVIWYDMIWYFLIWYLPVPYLAFRYSAHIDILIWYFFYIILLIYHIISLWYIDIWISHQRLKNFDEIWRSIVQNEKIFYVSAHLRATVTFQGLNQNRNGKISRYGDAFGPFSINPEWKICKIGGWLFTFVKQPILIYRNIFRYLWYDIGSYHITISYQNWTRSTEAVK